MVVFPEIAQNPEVGTLSMRYVHKTQIFFAPLLDLPRTENALAVGIDQYRGYQPGIKGMLPFAAVVFHQRRGIYLLKDILVNKTAMIFGQ